MHQHLKNHPEEVFMWFQKVYVYCTNTKKPWDKLTIKERESKKFQWTCYKYFCVSKFPITEEDIRDHEKICPESIEMIPGTNDNTHMNKENWIKSKWYDVYGAHPIIEYDLQLLNTLIGIRMIHFVNNISQIKKFKKENNID